MTDKLIEQIKADREAGTPGNWEVAYEGGETHLYMHDHPDMKSQMCDPAAVLGAWAWAALLIWIDPIQWVMP